MEDNYFRVLWWFLHHHESVTGIYLSPPPCTPVPPPSLPGWGVTGTGPLRHASDSHCLPLSETAQLVPTVGLPHDIPTSNVWMTLFLCILTFDVIATLFSHCSHPDRCIYFSVLLICISLMVNDTEHLSGEYLPSVYPLWWNVFWPNSNWIVLYCFVLLFGFEYSLYILDTSPVLDT